MNPGPKLDRIVCEAVGIPCCILNGVCVPSVSTAPTFEQFQRIMDWLRRHNRLLYLASSIDGWIVRRIDKRGWSYIGEEAPTIPRAVCEAVRAVVEAGKEGK